MDVTAPPQLATCEGARGSLARDEISVAGSPQWRDACKGVTSTSRPSGTSHHSAESTVVDALREKNKFNIIGRVVEYRVSFDFYILIILIK